MISLDELMSDGLSQHDLAHMTEIIRENHGDWYHAKLMRALHILLPHADSNNVKCLKTAYPGSVLAYMTWYNNPQILIDLSEGV